MTMAATQIDVPYLSSYIALPDTSLAELLSSPTIELVETLLNKILIKAREHNEAQSDKLQLEVELESAVRAGESKSRQMKESVDKSLQEVSHLRQQLQTAGNFSHPCNHLMFNLL